MKIQIFIFLLMLTGCNFGVLYTDTTERSFKQRMIDNSGPVPEPGYSIEFHKPRYFVPFFYASQTMVYNINPSLPGGRPGARVMNSIFQLPIGLAYDALFMPFDLINHFAFGESLYCKGR